MLRDSVVVVRTRPRAIPLAVITMRNWVSFCFIYGYGAPLGYCRSSAIIRNFFTVPFLKYKRLKLKSSVSLAGHNVAMVTYSVKK